MQEEQVFEQSQSCIPGGRPTAAREQRLARSLLGEQGRGKGLKGLLVGALGCGCCLCTLGNGERQPHLEP